MRKLIAILAAAIGVLVLFPTPEPAQSCLCVTDAVTEANTGIIATSVTTPAGLNSFQSQAQYLASLMGILDTGVSDPATLLTLYPGWVDPGPNGASLAANITHVTMQTYADVVAISKSQAADFPAQDAQLQTLAAQNAASVGVLQALQIGNQIALAGVQQAQLRNQLEITHLILDAAHDAEQLNERAQWGASNQVSETTTAQQ
jgi:hypothetical protein